MQVLIINVWEKAPDVWMEEKEREGGGREEEIEISNGKFAEEESIRGGEEEVKEGGMRETEIEKGKEG